MEALTTWLRGPRTLQASLLRVLIPRTVLFATVGLALLVGNALSAGATSAARLDAHPAPAPVLSIAEGVTAAGCVPLKSWPAGKPAAAVVVRAAADGRVSRVGFDRAWSVNHNGTRADDLWVVAVCP